jgi:hypothetical protein
MINEEELQSEIFTLKELIKEKKFLLEQKQEELRLSKSLKYIGANDITLEKIHVTTTDPVFDYVHDNDKFDCLIRENISLPWFSSKGFIYQTSIVISGKSKWDAGTPVRLSDFSKN